jgi:hypothetical protein
MDGCRSNKRVLEGELKKGFFVFFIWWALVSLLISWAPLAFGYEAVPVKDGGTLKGVVELEGGVPEPRTFPAVLYPFGPLCQKNQRISDGKGNIFLRDVIMGPNEGLKDVVVAIEGVEKGKPFKTLKPEILSIDCEFLPSVTVVQNHGEFIMKNEDPVLHNSQVYQAGKGNVILNVPIPPNSTKTHPIEFEKGRRIYQIICGMHEFMQTWGFAAENPYYALTKEDGEFIIRDIPPGTYKVTAWHPIFDFMEKTVTIPPNGEVELEFEFDSSDFERSNYEIQKKFRIQ